MKFSKDTLATLKNFATINGGIVLKPGNFVMTRSVNSAIYAEATIADEIDVNVGIYDLNAFMSIISLADDNAEILVKGDDISIKGARSEIVWPSADPDTIVSPKKPINFPAANVTFDLSPEDFQQLMRVSRGLGADTVTICSEAGKIVVKSFNAIVDVRLEKPLYRVEVADYEGSGEFNFVLKMVNMKLQQDGYKVLLWGNNGNFAARFEGSNINYVIAIEAISTGKF